MNCNIFYKFYEIGKINIFYKLYKSNDEAIGSIELIPIKKHFNKEKVKIPIYPDNYKGFKSGMKQIKYSLYKYIEVFCVDELELYRHMKAIYTLKSRKTENKNKNKFQYLSYMKYIISESRLLSVIHKFLDKKTPDPQVVNGIVYWGEPGDSDLVLDIENKLLLVGQLFIDSVSNVFGISDRESISIIKKYLQIKGFEIDRVV